MNKGSEPGSSFNKQNNDHKKNKPYKNKKWRWMKRVSLGDFRWHQSDVVKIL